MRILVFSDTHNSFLQLKRIIDKHSDIDTIIHAGDGTAEIDDIRLLMPNKIIFNVSGNCDYYSSAKSKITAEIENKLIFIKHGHAENVKNSLNEIIAMANTEKADVLIFGHTHIPYANKQGRLHILNPGSLTQPRGGRCPTYGILEIAGEEISCSIIEVKN